MRYNNLQGATFNEIVYEYDKKHSQQLVYVALSRVTPIEGLYIMTGRNNPTFYHGQRESTSVIDYKMNSKGYRSSSFKQSLIF